jgi:MEMO1 family protein
VKVKDARRALQTLGQFTILFIGMGVTPTAGRTAAAHHPRVRPSLVDGLFYPSERSACAARVDELLSASPVLPGNGDAVVTPHAGWDYAGDVMAAAFRSIAERRVRTAVLVGPVHRDPAAAVWLPESSSFATPLGPVPVDTELVDALAGLDPLFQRNDLPHLEEHCLEVQLPFLARLFPGVAILPLLVGNHRAATVAALARALRLTREKGGDYTVFIVTANMASSPGSSDADTESTLVEGFIEKGDGRGMLAALEKRQLSACGVAGIAALLGMAGDSGAFRLLTRGTSRGRDPDADRVVRYAAAGITFGSKG